MFCQIMFFLKIASRLLFIKWNEKFILYDKKARKQVQKEKRSETPVQVIIPIDICTLDKQ